MLPAEQALTEAIECKYPWERRYEPGGKLLAAPYGTLTDGADHGTWSIDDGRLTWSIEREIRADKLEQVSDCPDARLWSSGGMRTFLCTARAIGCDDSARSWVLIRGSEEMAAKVAAVIAADDAERRASTVNPVLFEASEIQNARIAYPPGVWMSVLDEDVNKLIAEEASELLKEELGLSLPLEADPAAAANLVIDLEG